jgi:hypothetical protein
VDEKPHKDMAITGILAFIWFTAVAVVLTTREDIPVYLLGIATLFFLMLVPSMKELVRGFERRRRNSDDSRRPSADD